MYIHSWSRRPEGTADADNPSAATIERRRQKDIEFLEAVKAASLEELHHLRDVYTRGWRRVAIDRLLRKNKDEVCNESKRSPE